jgi:hypothetical protein
MIRPYLGYGNISTRENTGNSTYNSLQATYKRRMSQGLMFGLAYTFSRAIGDASDFNESPQDSYNLKAERGLLSFDRTHMFVGNYIYELPIFRDHSKIAGKMLGGWQITGVTTYLSGTPRNLGLTGGTIGLATRPDVKAGGELAMPKTVAQWFDTSRFSAPAFGVFGNAGRNTIRGPGMQQWDVALFKTFRPTERYAFTVRGEAFNVFNHTNFDSISMNYGAGNFGQVTSARAPRLMELSAKFEF